MYAISRTTEIGLTAEELTDVIDVLNQDVYEEDGETFLTASEVNSTPALSDYLLDCLLEDSEVKHDPAEVWNMDGFCDWKSFRA